MNPWARAFRCSKNRCKDKTNPVYGGKGIRVEMSSDDYKTLWYRDRAYLMKKPTIDRIDNSGNYTIDNCRYLEARHNYGRELKKPVAQKTVDGIVVKIHESGHQAARETNSNFSHILACCRGKRETHNSYKWAWA